MFQQSGDLIFVKISCNRAKNVAFFEDGFPQN